VSEGDCLKTAAVVARNHRTDMTVADNIGLDDPHWSGGNARSRPAHSIGPAAIERSNQLSRNTAGREQSIDQQHLAGRGAGDWLCKMIVKKCGELREAVFGDRQPRRHGVPAAGREQAMVFRREYGCAEINPRDRAARALADAVLVERDDDRGTAELLLEAPSDNADHARVPAASGRDGHCMLGAPDGRLGRFLHDCFDRPAFLIEPVELGRETASLLRVSRREQAHAEIGFADAPPGIDPGTKREAEIARSRRPAEPGCLDQCVDADVAALCHHLEALRDEGAVKPLQRSNVGDGAERHEIKEVEQARLGPGGKKPARPQSPH